MPVAMATIRSEPAKPPAIWGMPGKEISVVRLLSPPGIITGLVVMLSVASGVAFGASVAGVVLAVSAAAKRAQA